MPYSSPDVEYFTRSRRNENRCPVECTKSHHEARRRVVDPAMEMCVAAAYSLCVCCSVVDETLLDGFHFSHGLQVYVTRFAVVTESRMVCFVA